MSYGDIFENLQFTKDGPNKFALAKMDGYSILRLALGKEARAPPHMASHSAFFLILKGRAVITSGDAEVELGENQYITLEANQKRGILALENLVILAVRD